MGKRYFLGANHCPKICCFCVHSGAPDLIYPGTSLYEHILWMHLEKNRTYACTFPVQRKEINVVKVRFTMRYSSRKLSNDKVITTACNFWRQIVCSFQVMSGNILFLGKKIFEIPPFFQTRPGDLSKKVHTCSLRFSALKKQDRPITRRWETGSEEHGDVLNCLFRTVNMAAKRWPSFSGIFSVFFLSELGWT